MPAKKMIRVLAATQVDGTPLLYPHPEGAEHGHRGWLGWEFCQLSEADHTIEGAAGLARKPTATGLAYDRDNTTGDMYAKGPDIHLRRLGEPQQIEETVDIRRALRCGDLVQACDACAAPMPYGQPHTCATGEQPAIPPVPPLPRRGGGR